MNDSTAMVWSLVFCVSPYLLVGCLACLYTLGRSMGAWRSWNKDAHAVLRLVEVLYALSLIVLWLPAIIVGMGIMKEAKNVGIGDTQEEWDAAVDELKGKTRRDE